MTLDFNHIYLLFIFYNFKYYDTSLRILILFSLCNIIITLHSDSFLPPYSFIHSNICSWHLARHVLFHEVPRVPPASRFYRKLFSPYRNSSGQNDCSVIRLRLVWNKRRRRAHDTGVIITFASSASELYYTHLASQPWEKWRAHVHGFSQRCALPHRTREAANMPGIPEAAASWREERRLELPLTRGMQLFNLLISTAA